MDRKFHSFENWANSPLRDQHPKLYGGYTDKQCDEFGITWTGLDNDLGLALGFKYPWERTQYDKDALRDCVAMMRGSGAGQLRVGKASRISLNHDNYLPLDSPGHSGDPRDTYARVRRAKERLAAYGFIGFVLGEKGMGKETIIWLTDKGWEWVNRLADPTALGEMKPRRQKGIQLRNARKKPTDFPWTDEARRMDTNVAIFNRIRRKQRIFRADGSPLPYKPYTRIFNRETDLSLGGRFYLKGTDNHQNMDHDKRRGLTWEIDGVRQATDEVDCSCLHAKLAYWEMGLPVPKGDLYDIPGYPRLLCKLAFQTMVNAWNNQAANGSLADDLLVNEDLREGTPLNRRLVGVEYYDRKVCKQYVWVLMRAIKAKHRPIKPMFCSGAGLRFQRLESDWAEAVMLSMIELIDLCPLYIYDSFRVPTRYKNLLRAVMKREALSLGLDLELKEDSHTAHIGAHPCSESEGAIDSVHCNSSISAFSVLHLEDSLSLPAYIGGPGQGTYVTPRQIRRHLYPVSLIRRADQDRGPPYG